MSVGQPTIHHDGDHAMILRSDGISEATAKLRNELTDSVGLVDHAVVGSCDVAVRFSNDPAIASVTLCLSAG
jgi:hypothetical protein